MGKKRKRNKHKWNGVPYNYSSKRMQEIIEFVRNMSVREYEKLYEVAKNAENVHVVLRDGKGRVIDGIT